jgi:hypothetical protein
MGEGYHDCRREGRVANPGETPDVRLSETAFRRTVIQCSLLLKKLSSRNSFISPISPNRFCTMIGGPDDVHTPL